MEHCEILHQCKEEISKSMDLEQILDIALYFLEAYAISQIAEQEEKDFLTLMRGEEDYEDYIAFPVWKESLAYIAGLSFLFI